jgi:hypothetical protein
MAHLTADEVDALASKAASAEEPAKTESLLPGPARPTLAYGAEGANVTKLVDLLAVLGHATNDVIKGGAPKLDEGVLIDVRAAQSALGVVEPPLGDIEGELVGAATWGALYEAATARLEAPAAI